MSVVAAAGRAVFGELGIGDAAVEQIAASLSDAQRDAHGAEIYLGAACAARTTAALATFERAYIARVPALIAAKRLAVHEVDEVCQTVRERLLSGEPPYIATAIGRGSLAGLVAVIANRAALDVLRANARHALRAGESLDDDELAVSGGFARDHVHARYGSAIKGAFEAAIAGLPARDRTLLRLHLVDGLTIDDLARMYDTHRATAARQLERAREAVAAATRQHLASIVPASELDELAVLVVSRLDLSLSRVLGEPSKR